MIYVGIDWADDHHEIHITNDTAKTLAKFQIPHDCDGFTNLHNRKQKGSHLVRLFENGRLANMIRKVG